MERRSPAFHRSRPLQATVVRGMGRTCFSEGARIPTRRRCEDQTGIAQSPPYLPAIRRKRQIKLLACFGCPHNDNPSRRRDDVPSLSRQGGFTFRFL